MRGSRYVLLAVLAGSSTAALAEPATGSRLGDFRRPGPALSARDQAEGAKRMAECLYNRKGELARQALLASTREGAEAATNRLMGNVQCFGAEFSNEMVEERHVSFPRDILRGMLAEAALERSGDQLAALQPLPLQQIYQRDWYAVTGRHISVDEMGACVADTNPAGVVALARTEPASGEENAAFGALMDNFGKCLRAGVKLQASRPALRAALSEALFQRLNAPTPAPVAAPAVEAAKR
jgi:hypothetical protein